MTPPPLRSALAKMRRSTELALGYPDATLTAAEVRAVLTFIGLLGGDVFGGGVA